MQTSTFHVYDDVLSEQDLQAVWEFVQLEDYTPVDSHHWEKVWRLTDGRAFSSPGIHSHGPDEGKSRMEGIRYYPTRLGIDRLIELIVDKASLFSGIVGERPNDWRRFSAKAFLYPVGTGLSWHEDSSNYTGAYAFYPHPEWKSSWGGELMIADDSCLNADLGTKQTSRIRVENNRIAGFQKIEVVPALDNTKENEVLSRSAWGHYIAPKPNRLVVFTQGIPHRIAKVDPAAGEHVRCSIAGFFQR